MGKRLLKPGSSRWYLLFDKARDGARVPRIRRMTEGNKLESLPAKKFAHAKSEDELRKFLEQLNHRHKSAQERAREAYAFHHRFITSKVLEEFNNRLLADIPDRATANNLAMALQRDCLNWFINQAGLVDPIEWKRFETQWGMALRCEIKELKKLVLGKKPEEFRLFDEPVHPDTIKKRIQVMNRFLKFLHASMPELVPSVTLAPISRAAMSHYKATYNENGEYQVGKLVTDADWKRIKRELSDRIKPFVIAQHDLGLRRSEALGLQADDLYQGYVEIARQLRSFTDSVPGYGPLKNRKPRKVEYWFTTPEELYELLPAETAKLHPSTYSALFAEEMERLGMSYELHDLRRTFITRAFRAGKAPRDIQLAVGHADLRTTMQYAQDDRQLEAGKRFKPKG